MRPGLAKAAVAVIAAGSLAACGGGGGSGDSPRPSGSGGKSSARASTSPPSPSHELDVPAAYDTSRGWELSEFTGYGLLPKADAVAVLTGTGSGYRVTVRDAATGQVRWTGRPLKSLAKSSGTRLLVTTVGGKEYVVTWSQGETGEDAVSKGEEMYAVDVYTADGSGNEVAPAHHVELPAEGYGEITDGGERLLISGGRVRALDVTTGKVTTYDAHSFKAPGNCSSCSPGDDIVAVTRQGPLVSDSGFFWVPGSWDSGRIAPAQADPETGAVWPINGGYLVARWEEKDGGRNVWAVLDRDTGQVQASVLCARPLLAPTRDPGSSLSPSGRYLVSEHLAFDLKAKKGHCFEETDSSKPLTFGSVTDGGIAYGTSLTADGSAFGDRAPVQLSLATGTPKALADGTEVPVADLHGGGVFSTTVVSEHWLIVYQHKS